MPPKTKSEVSHAQASGRLPTADPSSNGSKLPIHLTGMQLKPYQIAAVAFAAGFSPEEIPTVVAIGLAESDGWTDQVFKGSAEYPEDSIGVMQVNYMAHGDLDRQSLFNPFYNMQSARGISRDSFDAGNGSFTPWSTFKNGKYKANLSAGTAALALLKRPGMFEKAIQEVQAGTGARSATIDVGGIIGDVIGAPFEWAAALAKLLGWLVDPHNWLRIGYVAGGAVLLGIGLTGLHRETEYLNDLAASAKPVTSLLSQVKEAAMSAAATIK